VPNNHSAPHPSWHAWPLPLWVGISPCFSSLPLCAFTHSEFSWQARPVAQAAQSRGPQEVPPNACIWQGGSKWSLLCERAGMRRLLPAGASRRHGRCPSAFCFFAVLSSASCNRDLYIPFAPCAAAAMPEARSAGSRGPPRHHCCRRLRSQRTCCAAGRRQQVALSQGPKWGSKSSTLATGRQIKPGPRSSHAPQHLLGWHRAA